MERNFKWFLFLRTFFYYSTLSIEILLLRGERYHFLPLYVFACVILIDNLINIFRTKGITFRVITLEIIYFSVFLMLTGDAQSPFIPFYFALILLAAANLSVSKTFVTAGIISVLHGVVMFGRGTIFPEFIFFLKIPSPSIPESILVYTIYVLLYFFVAAISGYIAERLKLEVERLRVTTEDILNAIEPGIITIGNNGKILFMNRAAKEFLFGSDTVRIKDFKEFPTEVKKLFEVQKKDREFKLRGRVFSISRYLLHKGLGEIFVITDLTEIKEMEKKLILYDRMATLGKFAADIAHEIRNPVMSIKGSAELLYRGKIKDKEEVEKLWNYIFSESQRLEKLTRDFLNFSKEIKIERSSVNLCELLKSCIDTVSFNPVFEKKKVGIKLHCDNGINIMVDGERMKSSIINLLENALYAVDEKNGEIEIKGYKSGDKTIIEVKDNGIGIPEEIQNMVFSPFFSTRKEGYGFGLAIVKKVVELHGGRIELSSKKGEGTRFRIIL